MLSAEMFGYIEAHKDLKALNAKFTCPECLDEVILKAGTKYVPHFAHQPGSTCHHGEGETLWHRKGKRLVADLYRAEGCRVELERKLGARRTDAMVTTPEYECVAFELQRKDEGLDVLQQRTRDLLGWVDRVVWVLPWTARPMPGGLRYNTRQSFDYICNSPHPSVSAMFFDDALGELISCTVARWEIYREPYDVEGYGEVGGYWHTSTRYVRLTRDRVQRLAHPGSYVLPCRL